MPMIKGRLSKDGALVDVRLGLSQTEITRLSSANQVAPGPIKVIALIDTGADATLIDPSVLQLMPLPISGFHFTNVPALGGLGIAVERDADIVLPHPSQDVGKDLNLPGWTVYEQDIGHLGYQMLVDRDVLDRCDFHYLGRNGGFEIEY